MAGIVVYFQRGKVQARGIITGPPRVAVEVMPLAAMRGGSARRTKSPSRRSVARRRRTACTSGNRLI